MLVLFSQRIVEDDGRKLDHLVLPVFTVDGTEDEISAAVSNSSKIDRVSRLLSPFERLLGFDRRRLLFVLLLSVVRRSADRQRRSSLRSSDLHLSDEFVCIRGEK